MSDALRLSRRLVLGHSGALMFAVVSIAASGSWGSAMTVGSFAAVAALVAVFAEFAGDRTAA